MYVCMYVCMKNAYSEKKKTKNKGIPNQCA
jgi:hypothetical protein